MSWDALPHDVQAHVFRFGGLLQFRGISRACRAFVDQLLRSERHNPRADEMPFEDVLRTDVIHAACRLCDEMTHRPMLCPVCKLDTNLTALDLVDWVQLYNEACPIGPVQLVERAQEWMSELHGLLCLGCERDELVRWLTEP